MDKYDIQIAKLLAANDFRAEVSEQWHAGIGLFAFVSPTGRATVAGCGCLVTIRDGVDFGGLAINKNSDFDKNLTNTIKNDKRIPHSHLLIKPSDLHVFAEWQRRLDKELRNG